jgi:DNA/RNA-binding domain of Phe-tRNA-synthetase-like protein
MPNTPLRSGLFNQNSSFESGKETMFKFILSDAFIQAYPDASAGVLVMRGAANPESPPALRQRTQAIEDGLRDLYAGWTKADIAALPAVQAYNAYYRRYKKTYHVQLQLESLVLKGRSLPRGSALLEAMFSAEIKNMLLTAGHDLCAVHTPVMLNAAQGDETYVTLSGESKTLKPGDMVMADEMGIISSVLYGPDQRTRMMPATQDVLFTVYAPTGIARQLVLDHLQDISNGVLLAAPMAQVELLEVFGAS